MFAITIFLIIILSIGWYTIKLGISPMPSSKRAANEIVQLIDPSDGPIIELGSGWGLLSYKLAKSFPDRKIIAYELSPIPFLFSQILKKFFVLHNLTLVRSNFLNESIPIGAALICYLYPGGMKDLEQRIEHYMPSLLVSNTFALPNKKADVTIRLKDIYNTPVYLYRFKN